MKLEWNEDDLRPLVQTIVSETLAAMPARTRDSQDRIAYSEAEAAALIGVETHVLREQRRLGKIAHCKRAPGRRILYRIEHINAYLDGRSAERQDDP